MARSLKNGGLLRDWLFYVAYWILITVFLTFILLNFMRTLIGMLELEHIVMADEVNRYFVSNYQYLESTLFGILFGSANFAINYFVDHSYLHKKPAGRIILIKTALYFIALVLVFAVVGGLLHAFEIIPGDMWTYLSERRIPISMLWGFMSFLILSSLLVNFIVFVNKKFGPGNLMPIFLGRYHQPEVENRIFMFLDLDGSTTIAEQIGHIKYSRLIQDCFLDINRLVPRSGGKIYQYVGDEVVITWANGAEEAVVRPVQFFFAFKKRIESKAHVYKSKYGVIPDFKAGMYGGQVTVAEIGDIKREIAYHGDVVNTASRLRDACKKYDKGLLTSEVLARQLPDDLGYAKTALGEMQLRGKLSEVVVYSVE